MECPIPRPTYTHACPFSTQGAPLDASIGEAGHQRHKRANKSGSGWDPAAHHARHRKTGLALVRIMRSQSGLVHVYDYATRTRFTNRRESAGVRCVRVLNCPDEGLRGGIVSPTDPDEGLAPTPVAAAGGYPGATQWNATILQTKGIHVPGAEAVAVQQELVTSIAESGVVPREKTVEDAMRVWYNCSRTAGDPVCGDGRCHDCQADGSQMGGDIHGTRTGPRRVPAAV